MGINGESDKSASLVIGPTSLGMVRIFVEAEGVDLPMDFEPDEALEIAEELRVAAERAMATAKGDANRPGAGSGKGSGKDSAKGRGKTNRGGRGGGGRRD